VRVQLSHDAGSPKEFPVDGLPEIAVAGRSNVGKSSFINALTGRRKLARTSAWPGKTRRIHFYRLADAAYLVDLPGYGYARVGRSERASWRPMVEDYLRGARASLRGVVLLVDLRRGPEPEEEDLLEWLAREGIASRVAFTKADKLKPSQRAAGAAEWRQRLGLAPQACAITSAHAWTGLADVATWVQEWSGLELRRPDGTPFP
jgi:GTP-binding protein